MCSELITASRSARSGRLEIETLFDDVRKRLVETSTRNRLVHVNRSNTRGNVVNIINGRSDDLYRVMIAGRPMRFLAIGRDKQDDHSGVRTESNRPAISDDRHRDLQLESLLGPEGLQRKLLTISREAQTAEADSGVNILYLALGFLTWFEDRTSVLPREAPLVLLPVELVRNARTSMYELRLRNEEIFTNLPLQRRLKNDFGIDLPEIDAVEDWRPSQTFSHVIDKISQRERWKVDPDAIQLGFFSFSKLLMHRDLAIESWPKGALADHVLTRGLLFEGFGANQPMFGPNDQLDAILPPEKLFHVVDADASQTKVIEEVRSGRNLVVQGPPGTGKSQTITNMVATAVREGRRVLFVAEKMAALSVVRDRLVKAGLQDICLELHSRTANPKSVLADLAYTLGQAAAIPDAPCPPLALRDARDKLNLLDAALHTPIGATGETAFSALARQARFIGLGFHPPRLKSDALASMSRDEEKTLVALIEGYGAALCISGAGPENPFQGCRNLDLQPVDLARLSEILRNAFGAVAVLLDTLRHTLHTLGSNAPSVIATLLPICHQLECLKGLSVEQVEAARVMLGSVDLGRLQHILGEGAKWRDLYDTHAATFVSAAFLASVEPLRAALLAGTHSFFARCGRRYRSASCELATLLQGPLPKRAVLRLQLIETLGAVQAGRAVWECEADFLAKALGSCGAVTALTSRGYLQSLLGAWLYVARLSHARLRTCSHLLRVLTRSS